MDGTPQQTNKGDTGTRVAFAFVVGVFLAILIPALYFGFPVELQNFMGLFVFLVVPVVGYFMSLAFLTLLQFIQCGRVAIGQVAAVSGLTPLFTLVLGGLAYLLPFLGKPIHAIIPTTTDPVETAMIQKIAGYSFYVFWGGMYGITVGSGLLAACP